MMRSGFSDAQCGFKALRAEVARALLPLIEDNSWFFDTELLVLAERNGLRIHEVPVDWVDDPDSSVHVARTAMDDLAGLLRMMVGLAAGRGRADMADRRGGDLRRYAGVGLVSTVAWLAIFLGLRSPLGSYAANAVSLLVCSVGSAVFQWRFAAHRDDPGAAATVGAIGYTVSLVLTSLGLLIAQGRRLPLGAGSDHRSRRGHRRRRPGPPAGRAGVGIPAPRLTTGLIPVASSGELATFGREAPRGWSPAEGARS